MNGLRVVIVLSSILALSGAGPVAAAPLKTGEAFKKALSDSLGISWTGMPLRSALVSLAERQGVAIVLDRRVDPDQLIEFSTRNQPLELALRQLAVRLKLGVAIFDSTIYFGPPDTARRLATVAALTQEGVVKQGVARRIKARQLPEVATPELATPRELLAAWSSDTSIKCETVEQIPHDLWPSLRLPAQSAGARAAILLAGFDLALDFGATGEGVRIVPMPKQPTIKRTHPAGNTPRQRIAQLEQQFPDAAIELAAPALHVSATIEDHELIARFLRGERIERPTVRAGEERFSLKVENQAVSAIARTIAQRVGRELVLDPSVAGKSNERVSFDVKEVTLEALLQKLLDPVGLEGKVTKEHLLIGPKR